MAEAKLRILLDQNVPVLVADWLRGQRPSWRVDHVNDLGLPENQTSFCIVGPKTVASTIVTFDEHFADAQFLQGWDVIVGVVRLRVWPTTIEATVSALSRLLSSKYPGMTGASA